MPRGDLVQRLQDAQTASIEIARDPGTARALAQIRRRAVLARQEALGEPVIGDDGDLLLEHQRLEVLLVVRAIIEIVMRLQALVAGKLLSGGNGQGLAEAGARVVGRADGADLAGGNEALVGAQGLLMRRRGVVLVGLVEIDAIGLQALQRALHRLDDVRRGKTATARSHVHADLGGEHDLVALAALGEPGADDGLGLTAFVAGHPARIHVRRVDGVEPGVDERVQDAVAHGLVRGPAEYVAAEHHGGDGDGGLSKWAHAHGGLRG